MIAPELVVRARPIGGRWTQLSDDAQLVEPVNVSPRNRRWRRLAVQHVAALSGIPVREVLRELDAAERRAS